MTKPNLPEIGTAQIVGNTLEVSISTPGETKIYVYRLADICWLAYFVETKNLCFTFLDNTSMDFSNIVSVENTEELDQKEEFTTLE